MAKAKIVVSSEEDEEVSNTNFSDEESPLESDSNDNGDIDEYDEEEEYEPQPKSSKSSARSRRRKAVDTLEEDEDKEDFEGEPTSLSNDEEEDDLDTNFEHELSELDDDLEPKNYDDDIDDDAEESEELSTKPTTQKGKKSIKITIKPPTRKPAKGLSEAPSETLGSSRSTRKRQVNYYQDDADGFSEDLSDMETPPPNTSKRVKIKAVPVHKPQQNPHLDPDLILTDEEEEYNPNAANDVSKMTERQRARLNTDVSGAIEDPYFDLDVSGKKQKQKKVKEETEEEIALRKAENARKRLDYKNKILEEEKRDTLNKLLKRRATKSRETIAEDKEGSVGVDEDSKSYYKERRATLNHPALIRYVNNTTTLNGNSVLAYK